MDNINFEFITFVNREKIFKSACNECISLKPNIKFIIIQIKYSKAEVIKLKLIKKIFKVILIICWIKQKTMTTYWIRQKKNNVIKTNTIEFDINKYESVALKNNLNWNKKKKKIIV